MRLTCGHASCCPPKCMRAAYQPPFFILHRLNPLQCFMTHGTTICRLSQASSTSVRCPADGSLESTVGRRPCPVQGVIPVNALHQSCKLLYLLLLFFPAPKAFFSDTRAVRGRRHQVKSRGLADPTNQGGPRVSQSWRRPLTNQEFSHERRYLCRFNYGHVVRIVPDSKIDI